MLARHGAASQTLAPTKQTLNICITFIQRRPNVFDAGPTLYKCHANVLCLLGMPSQSLASLSAGRDEALLGDHLQETPAVMATGDMRPRRQRMGACAQACV